MLEIQKLLKDENYYLILGARTNDNQGCVLLYKSQDLKNFEYFNTITTPKRFGYMWNVLIYLS